jgi:hypothetical protein
MTHHTTNDSSMQSCIDACNQCYQMCLRTAMNHCLESGGRHVDPQHFRLMMNCAEICQTSVNFMLSHSAFSSQICGVCAETCEACAESCEQIGDMEDCARTCRECAKHCRQMAGAEANENAPEQQRSPSGEL